MQIIKTIPQILCMACVLSFSALSPRTANATVVEIQTVLGTFEVNLTDETTPDTVANFLAYVNNSDYSNSIFHRSVSNFIIQGGGFVYDSITPLIDVPALDPVTNEPEYSSLRGTIAMAKVGGDANSATSQWFINLTDNSAQLDEQNGGFTVFGQVVGDGMDVVDAIAALSTFAFPSPLDEIPLIDYPASDPTDDVNLLNDTNLVIVNAIVISDAAVDSGAGLNLATNTRIVALLEEQARVRAEQEERDRLLRENKASGLGLIWLTLLGSLVLVRRLRPKSL